MPRVAGTGLGRMGRAMAGRFLDAGHELVVHNRTPARAAELVARGAGRAATPREAAEGADGVVVMVSDDDASRAVWDGPDGILAAVPAPGAIAGECSTLSHDHVTRISAAARDRGLRYIDAAAAGRLTLLVGAACADLEAAAWVLAPLAAEVVHFGPPGAGTTYTLIVNLIGAVQIAGVAEGLAMAERAGLDLDLVMRTIATGQAASPQVVRNGHRMAGGDHDDVVFTGALRRKDTACGVLLADALGVRARLGRVALGTGPAAGRRPRGPQREQDHRRHPRSGGTARRPALRRGSGKRSRASMRVTAPGSGRRRPGRPDRRAPGPREAGRGLARQPGAWRRGW